MGNNQRVKGCGLELPGTLRQESLVYTRTGHPPLFCGQRAAEADAMCVRQIIDALLVRGAGVNAMTKVRAPAALSPHQRTHTGRVAAAANAAGVCFSRLGVLTRSPTAELRLGLYEACN